MKNMRSNLFVCIIFLITVCCVSVFHVADATADEIMKVGYRILAPHSLQGGTEAEAAGAAVEYLETYVAPGMRVDIRCYFLSFSRMISYLDTGKIDAVLLLGKTSERQKKYLYPAKSVTAVNSGLAMRKTAPLTQINTADDLKDLTIGYTKNAFLSPFMRSGKLRFDFTAGTGTIQEQLLRKLEKGRIDAIYNPTLLTLKYNAKLLGNEKELKFIELPEPPIDLYVVFSKTSAGFFKNFDDIYSDIYKTFNYQDILKKYVE